jgi:hypothetical protein
MGFNKRRYFKLYHNGVGVIHSIKYKMVNNAIVLPLPNHKNNTDVQFKISKLTADELKLFPYITYTYESKIKDEDVIV